MSAVAGFLPHSPAKEGPFSGTGWGGWGEAIADELARGLNSRVGRVADAASSLMRVAEPSIATLSSRGAAGGNTTINQNNVFQGADTQVVLREAGREVLRAFNEGG